MSILAGPSVMSSAVLASLAFNQVAMETKEVWRMMSGETGMPTQQHTMSFANSDVLGLIAIQVM